MSSQGRRGERVNVQMPECWTIRTGLKQDKLPLLYQISGGVPTGDCPAFLELGLSGATPMGQMAAWETWTTRSSSSPL